MKSVFMFSLQNVLFVLIVIIISATGGFFAGRTAIINAGYVSPNPIFKTINATVDGKITQSTGSEITLTDSQNHTATFPLQPQVIVSKRDPNSIILATVNSSQPLELNTNVFVTLVWENKQFIVSHIVYP